MKSLSRVALVLWTAASMIVSPVYAQAQSSASQQDQQSGQQQTQTPQSEQLPDVLHMSIASQPGPAGPVAQKPFALGPDYSRAKNWFPNFFDQFWPTSVPPPSLTNAPKLGQLVKDGKLMLSLDDAIALALEDNLDINVQQYQTWIAQTQLLKAESGGVPQAGTSQAVTLGAAPSVSFDPAVTAQASFDEARTPVNNVFTSGVGNIAVPVIAAHQYSYNFGFAEGFHTGTLFQLTWDNTRATTDNFGYLFTPYVQSTLTASISQPLLAGCCILPVTRYIIEQRNSSRQAQAQFLASVIADVSQAEIDYWELVYDGEYVKVQQEAVAVAQKLYDDNKKQLQIGTMAPLDVLTAQSALASAQQALVAAQTNDLEQQTKLLYDITKNPQAPDLANVEIVPTTPIETPEDMNTPIDQLMAEAWQNVPQMTFDRLQLENDKIEVKVTSNLLKPSLSLYAEYSATGLTGIPTASNVISEGPGVGVALNQMINANFPTFVTAVSLGLPIRNRSAQSDSARAQIDDRQEQVVYQKDRNTIYVNVRSSLIALEQDRAAVSAATEATRLANQTLIDEEKKYQLGASDPYQVVQMARDLTAAQGVELRNRINLIEAQVQFDQSMGRTLKANNITVADALGRKMMGTPNIPGTPDTDAANPPLPRNPWASGNER